MSDAGQQHEALAQLESGQPAVTQADHRSGTTIRDAAIEYMERGWAVLPIPSRSKNPGFNQWQQLRIGLDEVDRFFHGGPQNLGVLLGHPSDWLIDIDLDHPRCVELADEYLPKTDAVFGRASKLRSHRIYRVTRPAVTKKFRSKSCGMLVELRSTGTQTVFPPSTHESGEPIAWEIPWFQATEVDPDTLMQAVERLVNVVKGELGEKAPPIDKPTRTREKTAPPAPAETIKTTTPAGAERVEQCLAALKRISHVDHRDGSHRLFICACRVVEYGLDDASALSVIRVYASEKPFPRNWTDEDVLRRIRDAERRCERGAALSRDSDGCIALGGRDPDTGRLVLSAKRTLPTAMAYVKDFHLHPAGKTIVNHAGVLMQWRGNRYVEVEDQAVKQRLQVWLHNSLRYTRDRESGDLILVDFESNSGTIKGALESIQAHVHIPATITSPSWLAPEPGDPPPREIVACRSSLLHLPAMASLPPTPRLFNVNALEFDHDPNAPPPRNWHKFLHQLFDGDVAALNLLQEWFGYCLTGDTSQQKMLLIVGPKRSGKGTIARVLSQLIGVGNVAGPTISSLAGPFGLQPLLGKSLAIVSDARFHGENVMTVVERLLCISGEDSITVDRKHLTSVTVKLPTRFMFLTNEFPRFTDASGALAGRFVILKLENSFYGREDHGLTERLSAELPGILNWAIEGWHQLHERECFLMPSSSEEVVQAIDELSSPVSAFVRDWCVVGSGHRTSVDSLYEAWKQWCDAEGRQMVSTKQSFGRDLAAAVAGVTRRRGTNSLPFYEGIRLK
jgi:putative DNA primase/helicase